FVVFNCLGYLVVIIGETYGTINYYENTVSTISPAFIERTGTDNPFDGENVGGSSSPSFADLDNDSDLDALIGSSDGTIKYYENTGSTSSPAFIERTGTGNPLDGEDINSSAHPELVDLDGDGDSDVVIGNSNAGDIRYFINDNAAPEFINPLVDKTGTDSPFNNIDVGTKSSPSFADLDDDGDPDLIVGKGDGTVSYFRNTGTSTNPIYTEQTNNPFDGIDVGDTSTPSFADLDGDGKLDAIIGSADGSLNYYQNTGDVNNPAFSLVTGTDSPVNGISATSDSSPTFVDLDNDGDLDLVLGNDTFYLKYYENTGNSSNSTFVERTSTDNPFNNQPVGEKSNASFADIDNDGDLDALVGRGSHGEMSYLENTGSNNNPAFVLMLDDGHPLNDVDLGTATSPSFVDVDGDDDLEAVVGESNGTFYYFLNQTPKYSLTTIEENETNPPGDKVGNIIPDDSVVDPNGAVKAIAVTAVDDANGTWQYQANGNTTWTDFGSVSNSNALLLSSNDMMRFVPNAGYKGESNFTFRLWDKTNGTAGAIADASSNGSITAFSEDTATGNIAIDPLPITVTGATEYTGTSLNDSLNGSSGADTIIGAQGNDSIDGNGDADRLHGDSGDDVLNGGANDDFINGGIDDDNISGGDGDDFLMGDEGSDTLSGDAGADTLLGGAGNDTLDGGAGADRLSGFGGSDLFVLSKGDANNIIYDYTDDIDKFGLELSSFSNSTVGDVFTSELTTAQSGTSTTISSGSNVLATVYNTTATNVTVDDFTDF
ncbi:MAG: calcium-binding protein, partial [Pleurocapsa sp.]